MDGVEEFDRAPRLVRLQMTDQMPLDIALGAERLKFGNLVGGLWTRLSPSVRTPASMASRMRAAGTVLLTATSVISEDWRPARSHAATIRRLISSSRALKSFDSREKIRIRQDFSGSQRKQNP